MNTLKSIQLKIAKIHPDACVPAYQSEGAACFDLHAVLMPEQIDAAAGGLIIPPGTSAEIHTGLKVEIPIGWRMDVLGRSGLWFKHRVRLGNNVGKIDNDFRGEVMVSLHNHGHQIYVVKHGERIAQAELNEVTRTHFLVVDESELSTTARGAGGYGSTGKI